MPRCCSSFSENTSDFSTPSERNNNSVYFPLSKPALIFLAVSGRKIPFQESECPLLLGNSCC
jgi:hypothetical protein